MGWAGRGVEFLRLRFIVVSVANEVAANGGVPRRRDEDPWIDNIWQIMVTCIWARRPGTVALCWYSIPTREMSGDVGCSFVIAG